MPRQKNEAREKAKEMQAFFTKFEVNGSYLPKEMQARWGCRLTSQGPTDRKRAKDVLAIVMFFQASNVSLYECLVAAGEQMESMKKEDKKKAKKKAKKR